MRNFILVCVVLAACGGKKDKCERLWDRMAHMAKNAWEDVKDSDKGKFVSDCREHKFPLSSDPWTKCVMDAESDEAVKKCPISPYRVKPKNVNSD